MTVVNRGPRAARNPYSGSKVGNVTFTVGTETSNAITVTGQVKGGRLANETERVRLRAWLSPSATGVPISSTYRPNTSVAAGASGTLIPKESLDNALLVKGGLAIHSTPEQFKTTATAYFRVKGAQYTKATTTGLTFSAGHVVSASKFGVILVQINAAGTVSTKVPNATQAYTTAALALAALPSPDAGNVALGYIAVAAKAATWTANTDDLTNGSDLTTATFVDASEAQAAPVEFDIIPTAAGVFTVVITDTAVNPAYRLVVQLPDGTLKVSPAIQFA